VPDYFITVVFMSYHWLV